MQKTVTLDLKGNFHRDIRRTKIRLKGSLPYGKNAKQYMKGFSEIQRGKVGDITAGKEPVDYVEYPYVEWYSEANGRVVLELEKEQVEVIGEPLPASQTKPISREQQATNMAAHMAKMVRSFNEQG